MKIFTLLFLLFGLFLVSLGSYGQPPQAAATIKKTGPSTAGPGDLLTYTITYSNTGGTLLKNVVIEDILPTGNYTYESSVPAPISVTSGKVTWEFAKLNSGSGTITVNLRAGNKTTITNSSGVAVASYDITPSPVTISNHATLSADGAVGATSSDITTTITRKCSFNLSSPSAGVKSATGSQLAYLVALTNSGNIYQQYTLLPAWVSSTNSGDRLFSTIKLKNGTILYNDDNISTSHPPIKLTPDLTPYIAPGETYFFYYIVTVPNGTKPNETIVNKITATPSVCGNNVVSNYSTFIYGGQYNSYELLSVYKIDTPDPVQAGSSLGYQLVISNVGDPLTNVRLTETYPDVSNATFGSASPTATVGNNIWDFPTLPSGNTIINVTLDVADDLPNGSTLTNIIRVSNGGTVYDTYTETTTVSSAPNLSILKYASKDGLTWFDTDSPSTIVEGKPGDIIYYKLDYKNNGNLTATSIVVKDNYDEAKMDVNDLNLGTNSSPVGEITWNIPGSLAPNISGSIIYSLKIKNDLTLFPIGSTNIYNEASISCSAADSNPNDNTHIAKVVVQNLPDLAIAQTVSSSPAVAGQPITYTITVTNVGNIDHTGSGYKVIEYLPTGTTYNTVTGIGSGTYSSTINAIVWTISSALPLPKGGTETFTVTLQNLNCNLILGGLTNTVTVYSDLWGDPTPLNNENTLPTAVVDNIAPVITLPSSALSLQCFDALAVKAWTDQATALDNCSGNVPVTASYTQPTGNCNQTVIVTFSAKDNGNKTSIATKSFTVNDNTAPTATAPLTVDLECSGDLPAAATTIAQFLALNGAAASDNCTVQSSLTVSHTDVVTTAGNCNGKITRTYTIKDACNNSVNVDQIFTVTDNTNPTATAPSTVDLECSGDLPAAASTIGQFLALNGAAASDNCTVQSSLTVSHTDVVTTAGNCNGKITRTYTIKDACNNSVNVDQIFTVTDNTNPTATAPSTVDLECSGDLPAAASTIGQFLALNGAAAFDNCTAQSSLTVSHTDVVTTAGSCNGKITRTYTIKDACNNSVSVAQVFTITDNTAPTATAPATVDLECSGDLPAAATTIAQFLALSGAAASDNCTIQSSLTVSHTDVVTTAGNCNGKITRTYTIKDACNNSVSVAQVFTVTDNTAPTATAPATVDLECSGDLPAAKTTIADFLTLSGASALDELYSNS